MHRRSVALHEESDGAVNHAMLFEQASIPKGRALHVQLEVPGKGRTNLDPGARQGGLDGRAKGIYAHEHLQKGGRVAAAPAGASRNFPLSSPRLGDTMFGGGGLPRFVIGSCSALCSSC